MSTIVTPRDRHARVRGIRIRLRPVLELARPYRKDLRVATVSGVVDQLLAIASGAVSAHLVGRAVIGASAFDLWPEAILLGFLVVPQVRMIWVGSIAASSAGYRIQVHLRERLFEAFERLAPAYMLRRRSGDLASVAIGDVDVVQRFFGQTVSDLVVGSTAPAAALAGLTVVDPRLGFTLAPFLAAAVGLPWWLHGRAERQGLRMREDDAETSAEIVDTVQGLRELLAFGRGAATLAELDLRADRHRYLLMDHARPWAAERAVAELAATAGTLTIVVVAVALVRGASLSPALLPPVVVVAALAFAPLARFHHAAKSLEAVGVSGERVFELLEEPPIVPELSGAALPDMTAPIVPTIRFDRVSFRYAPDLPPALDDVSFEVPEGATVALMGHSGAGKSTCLNLLLRFFDPSSGAIRLGGVDLRELPTATLREQVAFVPQDTYLFNISVADNIRLGHPDAGDDAVRAAAAAAIADEFIEALPEAYDTIVGERGGLLSGGQRQRLAIARALLRDPATLVMDEPVSSLDAENERALRVAMARVRRARTTLVIAHRLSTIRSADLVVVLAGGRVAEVGTHDDLLNRGGAYAGLVSSQIQT